MVGTFTTAPVPVIEPLLLTIPQVAIALGISRAKAYQLVQDGTIPTIKLGRNRRVQTAALRRWVEERAME